MGMFSLGRLNDGSPFPTSMGSVEVFYEGKWSTVCDDNFDDNSASK